MSVSITSLTVYGFNGDPCAQTGSDRRVFFSTRKSFCAGQQRYNLLKANSLRIRGENLSKDDEIRLSSTANYEFRVIEVRPYGDDGDLIVYFLVWENSESDDGKGRQPKTVGDLTVIIDTTPPANTDSETEPNVDYEP